MHKPAWRATVQMARAPYLEIQILVALADHLASRTKSFIRTFLPGYQSPGSPMAMAPKGGNPALTGADIDLVLRYLLEAFVQE